MTTGFNFRVGSTEGTIASTANPRGLQAISFPRPHPKNATGPRSSISSTPPNWPYKPATSPTQP
jgi:hypothetical protein